MNASPFLLVLLSPFVIVALLSVSGTLTTTTGQEEVEAPLEVSCPDSTDIEPCTCSTGDGLQIDCSRVQNEEQLLKVFSASFPITDFRTFFMTNNNGVKVLDDGVFGDISFQEVTIQKSALETVEKDALNSSLSTLKYIEIDYCPLKTFPFEKVPEFTTLKKLSLYHTKINSLPLVSSSSLLSLRLSYNPISHLSPDAFTLLPAIQSIIFDGCNLTEITPGIFKGLPNLSLIKLSENKISHLQSLTFDLFSTQAIGGFIGVENNNIESVEVDAFKGVQTFALIYMMRNALTTLGEDVWRPVLERNNTISFYGNYLSCGCDVAWLVRNPHLLTFVMEGRCADGELLTSLDPADFVHCGW